MQLLKNISSSNVITVNFVTPTKGWVFITFFVPKLLKFKFLRLMLYYKSITHKRADCNVDEKEKQDDFSVSLHITVFQIYLHPYHIPITKLQCEMPPKSSGMWCWCYLMLGPSGLLGGCQEMARKDSLTGTTTSGSRPSGIVGSVVAVVGRLSVHPPTCPPPMEHANTVIL